MSGPTQKPARPRPWEGASGEASSFGSWLRRQREARDIALREVAEASKINIRYLEALEEDRFEALPAPVFAKGFLREYARYVGLSPDEVVNSYLAALQLHQGIHTEPSAPARSRSGSDWAWGLLLTLGVIVLLGAVALLAFYAERRRKVPAPQAVPPPVAAARPSPPPVPVAPEPAAAPAAPLRLNLDFSEDCWVESQADGAPRVSELRVQGESVEILAQEWVLLTLGNALGVRVEVNGQPYPLPPPAADGSVHDLRIEVPAEPAAGSAEKPANPAAGAAPPGAAQPPPNAAAPAPPP